MRTLMYVSIASRCKERTASYGPQQSNLYIRDPLKAIGVRMLFSPISEHHLVCLVGYWARKWPSLTIHISNHQKVII